MNTEQERAEFEAWASGKTEMHKMPSGEYSSRITRLAWEAHQAGRAALQSQRIEPNDLMLSGVIRMPFDMAMASEISRLQFYQRAQQALNELEALQSQCEIQLQVWRSTDSCMEFWSWDEADQYDYDQAKPENRRIIQIVKEG